ncbi:MAG: DUF3365 domain-containing protein [Spirochaetota bacterium]|nr:DUF3365 domain-containing protein [Spirochaetota bacterium]
MIRNFTLISLVASLFLLMACGDNSTSDKKKAKSQLKTLVQKYKKEIKAGRKLKKEFMQTLGKQLKEAIKKSGPAGAISICKTASSQAEQSFKSKDPNILSFRRISSKPRNVKDHTPTAAETKKLDSMEKRVKAGKHPGLRIIAEKDSVTVLYPIRVGGLCLQCHGDPANMDKKVLAEIKKHYPDDKATGYKAKDFRGAFAIKWKQ